MALAKRGDVESARAALQVDDLICVSDLAAPMGYPTNELFHSALLAEIQQHPTIVKDPQGKATRGGHQTTFLGASDGPAVGALIKHIQQQVEHYTENLLAKGCTFALARPCKARLAIWAVIYDDEGRQDSHFHPGGWLSGVYYPQIPKSDVNDRTGELLVGALDSAEGYKPPWGVRAIKPTTGQLVLFPSYVPHATAPATAGRVAIAFDVVPLV